MSDRVCVCVCVLGPTCPIVHEEEREDERGDVGEDEDPPRELLLLQGAHAVHVHLSKLGRSRVRLVHTCACACVCVRACMCVRVCVHACV